MRASGLFLNAMMPLYCRVFNFRPTTSSGRACRAQGCRPTRGASNGKGVRARSKGTGKAGGLNWRRWAGCGHPHRVPAGSGGAAQQDSVLLGPLSAIGVCTARMDPPFVGPFSGGAHAGRWSGSHLRVPSSGSHSAACRGSAIGSLPLDYSMAE